MKLTDAGGYNAALNITTANNLALYTATGGATLKGVDFTPIPEPATLTTVAALGAIAVRRRRGTALAMVDLGTAGVA